MPMFELTYSRLGVENIAECVKALLLDVDGGDRTLVAHVLNTLQDSKVTKLSVRKCTFTSCFYSLILNLLP